MTSCRRGEGVGSVGMTNNVEGCIKKHDKEGGGVKNAPKWHDPLAGINGPRLQLKYVLSFLHKKIDATRFGEVSLSSFS